MIATLSRVLGFLLLAGVLTACSGANVEPGEKYEYSPQQQRVMKDGTVTGGMIPKLETCLTAIKGGAGAAHILDGRLPHVLLLEIFTELGVGTMVTPN